MSGFPQNTSHGEAISAITKPVEITDHIVSQWTGLGEFTDTNTNAFSGLADRVARMGDHVEFLTKIVNQEHENANFELKGVPPNAKMEMKADALNKVSRLVLNEFSLYTKDTPLSEKEFNTFLQRVGEIAQNSHENLHLVLASVALLGPDNQVHNIEMHVQCGKQPTIKSFAKFVPSPIDAVYPNTFNPSFIGKGVMPHFLDRTTRPDPTRNLLSFDQINGWINNQFNLIKFGNNAPAPRNQIKAWLGHTCNELAKIKDPDYLPPKELTDCATQLLSSVNAANSPAKMRLLEGDFKKFKKAMEDYKAASVIKNNAFRSAISNPVTVRTNAPDEVHVDDFGKFKSAATSKNLADMVQATADSLSDPNKHSVALGWLNEIQRNLLPSDVTVNKAIDDLKIIIDGRNDARVAPARAFKDELNQAVDLVQKKPLTTIEYDQLNVFKAQYSALLEDGRNILSNAQKLKIDTDVKPHFEKVFDKIMYTNMANIFAADMDNVIKNYDKDPAYYAGLLELQKERLDTLISKQNITEPKVLALSTQLDVMLKKIESKKQLEVGDFTLFVTNKNELDAAINTVRNQNTITDGEIKEFVKAKEKMDGELNATILDGTVKADATLTDTLKQKVKDYQENDFNEAIITELNKLSTEWDADHAKPEFQQRVGRIQKIVNNIHNALPESDRNQAKKVIAKLSENKKIGLFEISSLRLALQSNATKLNQMPYSTFPVGESHDIGYDPIAKCKTAGGVWFNTETQICLDHAYDTVQASRASMQRQESSTPISPFVSHVLTSNSMPLEKARTYTKYVTHADIRGDTMGLVEIDAGKTTKTIQAAITFSANPSTMKPTNGALYGSTTVTKDPTTPEHLWIRNPPFGPEWCSLRKYPAHTLSPMPLNNGSTVSQDSFTSSYYVSKVESILLSIPVPDGADKQKKCITDFANDLATLKNKSDAKVTDFYNALDKFREDITKVTGEDTKKMLGHIDALENYLDTKLLPPEYFLASRTFNSVNADLTEKQKEVVDKFSVHLAFCEIFDHDLNDPIVGKQFADEYFDFKKALYAIPGEDISKLTVICKKIEKDIEQRYPQMHQVLKTHHEEHAKTGPNKLCEDYYQSQLDKRTAVAESEIVQSKVVVPNKKLAESLASAKRDYESLKKEIGTARESIKNDELRIEQLKLQVPQLEQSLLLAKEKLVLDVKAFEEEANTLKQIQENKKEAEQILSQLRETHDGLMRDRDGKTSQLQGEISIQEEMTLQQQKLADEKRDLDNEKSGFLKTQGKLQNDKDSLESQININDRKSSEISEKIGKMKLEIISNDEKINIASQNVEKYNSTILSLQNKISSLDNQCEKLSGEISTCNEQIKEYEMRLGKLDPLNANHQADITRNTDQLNDFKKRRDLFQKEYNKFDANRNDLNVELSSAKLERDALLNQVEKLNGQNLLLNTERKSLESSQKLLQSEKQSLLENQQKILVDMAAIGKKIDKVTRDLELNAEKNVTLSSQLLSQQEKIRDAEAQVSLAETSVKDSKQNVDKSQQKVESLTGAEKLQLTVVTESKKRSEDQNEQVIIAQKKVTNGKDEQQHLEGELPNKKGVLKKLTDKMEGVDSKYRELESQMSRQTEAQKEQQDKNALAQGKIEAIKKEPEYRDIESARNRMR